MRNGKIGRLSAAMLLMGTLGAAQAAVPVFNKAFAPSTIGPGSVSLLTFTIDNSATGAPASSLAFTDNLPAGMTIATPVSVSSTCGGSVTALAGGSSISLTDGRLGLGESCTIRIPVTGSTVGVLSNVSGSLSSNLGMSGTANADLTVSADRPGFSKSFSPASIGLGTKSTLTFTVDNTANATAVTNLSFVDNLPTGMQIASPSNATSTCLNASGAVTYGATPGSTSFSYNFNGGAFLTSVAAGATCTVSVDVTTTAFGDFINLSGDGAAFVSGSSRSTGLSTALLQVPVQPLTLAKSFENDPVPPGGTANVRYRLFNLDRSNAASSLSFTDDFDAVLSGLTLSSVTSNTCGGSVSGIGTGLLSFSGGSLGVEANCEINVQLSVPTGAASGSFASISSALSGNVSGTPTTGTTASDSLQVSVIPILTKSFTDDPVGAGGVATLEFTLTNPSPSVTLTDVAFTDTFTTILATSPSGAPAAGFCNSSGTASFFPLTSSTGQNPNPASLNVSGITLAPSASCTFSITLNVSSSAAAGNYVNTTSDVTGTAGGSVVGPAATDTLVVVAPPRLTKSFTSDPVLPGGTVTLQYTLSHDEAAPGTASAIAFTDDLNAALTGLAATGTPISNACGAGGGTLSGTTSLSFSGATLAAGETCQFSVTLQVPAGATSGSFTSTTSAINATVSGKATVGLAATDQLLINGLQASKQFINDPVFAGANVTLRYTLNNISPTDGITGLSFQDNYAGAIPNMSRVTVPSNGFCGGSSAIAGSPNNLVVSGVDIAASGSCTFDVVLLIPVGTAEATYISTSGTISATQSSAAFTAAAMVDSLQVAGALRISKSFTNDPAQPSGTVNLRYTLENLDGTNAATALAFTDNLDAALSGLAATGLPASTCGGTLSGTSTVSFSAGTLAAGASCNIDVTLSVPGTAGGSYPSSSSSLTGTINGVAQSAPPATDTLQVYPLGLTLQYAAAALPGGNATLQVQLQNASSSAVSGVTVLLPISTSLSGVAISGLPQSDVCGAGSTLSGSTNVLLQSASLAAGATCSFNVSLTLPGAFATGSYPISAQAVQSGLAVSGTASGSLAVIAPTLSKAFAPAATVAGGVSTVTLTINNSAYAVALSGISVTDTLPSGLVVATPASASTTCTGGTLTAVAGSGTISYSGGAVAANSNCTVSFNVAANTAGSFVNNTSALTLSLGTRPAASATLNVSPIPTFSKAFAPSTVPVNVVSTLTFTINNSASTQALSALDFTDNLPAGLLVATTPSASTTCTGGTLTAVAGSGVVSYTGGGVAAGATCTVQANVVAAASGSYVNTSGALSTGFAQATGATATLTVVPIPVFSQLFTPNVVTPGNVSTLRFTIDNSGSISPATGLAFNDNLPVGLLIASPSNASSTCTGGTLTAATGTGVISLTGATAAALGTCTVQVDVSTPTVGSYVNNPGTLSTSLGNATTGDATLTVATVGLTLNTSFAPTQLSAGDSANLQVQIQNASTTLSATGVAFTEDLGSVLSGIVITGLPLADACGAGSTVSVAGSVISLSGGQIAASGNCSFNVPVQVPAAAATGRYTFTSSAITGMSGGLAANGTAATATLDVVQAPTFSQAFNPLLVAPNAASTLIFTINNAATPLSASGLGFSNTLPAGLVVANPSNAVTTCTGGTLSAATGSSLISLSSSAVGPSANCTVSVDVSSAANGIFVNNPGTLTTSFGNATTADATLTVGTTGITLSQSISPTVIRRGDNASIQFQIQNASTSLALDGIAFTEDVGTTLPGLVVQGLPQSNVCGAGSSLSFAGGVISFSGGQLAASGSCTFSVVVQVPTGATLGSYTFTTSTINGTSNGFASSGTAASASVDVVQVPVFTQAFGPALVPVNSTSTLTFTINNAATPLPASSLSFTDTLPTGLVIANPSNASTTCTGGTLSSASGSSLISLSGATVGANSACSVSVDVSSAANGIFVNNPGTLTTSFGNATAADATLTVGTTGITLSQTITPSALRQGDSASVQFQLQNSSTSLPLDSIAFTEDLGAVLPGVLIQGLPQTNICGTGSSLTLAGGVVSLSAGQLPASGTCTFSVSIQVPTTAAVGTYTFSTSAVSGMSNGFASMGTAATTTLSVVTVPTLVKVMPSNASAGGVISIRFDITNPAGNQTATGLSFTDDLNAFIPGAVAVGLPQSDVCGPGSTLTGTSVISFSGGSLAPGATCSIHAQVRLPQISVGGNYVNVTSPLQSSFGGAALPGGTVGSAGISVGPPVPTFIPAASNWMKALMVLMILGLAGEYWRRQG